MNDVPHNSRTGTRLGPYQLNRLLGRGGMGEVYEAEDTTKGRTVALKLLPDSLSHDPVFRERLQREARAAGRLQEPHVVPIHDYGEIDGLLYVDMRLIQGRNLRAVLDADGVMAPDRAVGIIGQVAAALDAAHAAGIAHRDVKPENILVTAQDFAYLVDFGIASAATDRTLTENGMAIGTYAYMAPERFSSKPVTYRADIYALACVLHQCLTGVQPYPADSISMLITAHLIDPPPRPSDIQPGIPPEFDDIVAKGMAKDADARYGSAGELARACAVALGTNNTGRPTVVGDSRPSSYDATIPAAAFTGPSDHIAAQEKTPRGGRHPLYLGAAAAVVSVVAVAGTVAWVVARPPDNAGTMPSTLTITRTVANEPPNPISTAGNLTPAERQLMTMVPDPTACTPNKEWDNAIAAVDCKPTKSGDGHARALFALYSDTDQLQEDFDSVTTQETDLVPCPGTTGSPTKWDYNDSPEKSEGSLACGKSTGKADLIWTKTSSLMLGFGQGNDVNALYNWWLDIT